MPCGSLIGSLIISASVIAIASGAKLNGPDTVVRAEFNSDGSVNLPKSYRNWTHVGTRIKAPGTNILDGLATNGLELLNTYADPSAMAAFEADGRWPDGSQIVKEFSSLKTDESCDPKTAYCIWRFGEGSFERGCRAGNDGQGHEEIPTSISDINPLLTRKPLSQVVRRSARRAISNWRGIPTTSSVVRTLDLWTG